MLKAREICTLCFYIIIDRCAYIEIVVVSTVFILLLAFAVYFYIVLYSPEYLTIIK